MKTTIMMTSTTEIDFDFLAWVSRAYFFHDSLEQLLIELNLPDVANMWSRSDAVCRGRNVIDLYQDYGQYDKFAWSIFIEHCWKKYISIINRSNSNSLLS